MTAMPIVRQDGMEIGSVEEEKGMGFWYARFYNLDLDNLFSEYSQCPDIKSRKDYDAKFTASSKQELMGKISERVMEYPFLLEYEF